MVEDNFMVSMMKTQGDLTGFFDRPIALALGALTLAVWAGLVTRYVREAARARAVQGEIAADAS